jgi:MoxR-like ATPase
VKEKINRLKELLGQRILGKPDVINLSLCCLFSNGHLLLEDIPGVGKTTLAKTLATLSGLSFKRIQFTNDTLPADLVGYSVYDKQTHEAQTIIGPIFSQFVLVDELNRGNPKTQSALLQAMEENQVTIDLKTMNLPQPFFVVATQNPMDQVGTNHLPESQLDRFRMRISIGYPDQAFEEKILSNTHFQKKSHEDISLLTQEDIFHLQSEIDKVKTSPQLVDYVLRLLTFTRQSLEYKGLSPRAGIDIIQSAKAYAYLNNRDFVLPEDVQYIFPHVTNHRILKGEENSLSLGISAAQTIIKSVAVLP